MLCSLPSKPRLEFLLSCLRSDSWSYSERHLVAREPGLALLREQSCEMCINRAKSGHSQSIASEKKRNNKWEGKKPQRAVAAIAPYGACAGGFVKSCLHPAGKSHSCAETEQPGTRRGNEWLIWCLINKAEEINLHLPLSTQEPCA